MKIIGFVCFGVFCIRSFLRMYIMDWLLKEMFNYKHNLKFSTPMLCLLPKKGSAFLNAIVKK